MTTTEIIAQGLENEYMEFLKDISREDEQAEVEAFLEFVWNIENRSDLADNYHIYSNDDLFNQYGNKPLAEVKEAFPSAWTAFHEEEESIEAEIFYPEPEEYEPSPYDGTYSED